MADRYLTPSLTDEGLSMIVRAINGETITFTKLVLGNGTPSDLDNVTEMANPLLDVSFTDSDTGDSYLLLTGEVSSADIESSFYGNELGVYAKIGDEEEVLYAYRYTENADFFPSSDSGRTIELTISVVVQVGLAENVTAILVEGAVYALKSDFDSHVANTSNPHSVTKSQVGLGNVPNVTTNNQTPTFTQAGVRTNIVSGEKLSLMLGKIAKLFADFSTHLSASNPHSINCSKIGASPTTHKHSAVDITSGTLSTDRGGTGMGGVFSDSYTNRYVEVADSDSFTITNMRIDIWGKVVHLKLGITSNIDSTGTSPINYHLATLKSGYRPAYPAIGRCDSSVESVHGFDAEIGANGEVRMSAIYRSGYYYNIHATYLLN